MKFNRLAFNFVTVGAAIFIMASIWYLPERVIGKLGVLLSIIGVLFGIDQIFYGRKE